MYSLTRKLLFRFSPETSHELSMDWLGAADRLGILKLVDDMPRFPMNVMGLDFPNPVGLAAGLDKNGDYFNALGALGFGFIEIGTVTPRPQPGNDLPRMFRLVEQNAIINRMGFNNKGVDYLVGKVRKRRYKGVLGINIGKNKATPEEHALDDYLYCLDAVYEHADYVTVNISSPNTPGLRDLQFGENLKILLNGLKYRQKLLEDATGKYVPLVVKIAPDLSDEQIYSIGDCLLETEMDGVIATNTTVSRDGVQGSAFAAEVGGLSGQPLFQKSTQVVKVLARRLNREMPIIGVGGIMNGADVRAKTTAGASLVQLYSGFIYRGPGLIKESIKTFK